MSKYFQYQQQRGYHAIAFLENKCSGMRNTENEIEMKAPNKQIAALKLIDIVKLHAYKKSPTNWQSF